MTYILACSLCRNRLDDDGGRALTLGLFFFLTNSVKRAFHGCPRGLIMQCDENRFLPSLPDPPASRPLPPVHYPGKPSLSKVFSALILALAYGYEVMSQLTRVCMPCYCRHSKDGTNLEFHSNRISNRISSEFRIRIEYEYSVASNSIRIHRGHMYRSFCLLSELTMNTTSYSRQTYPHISYVHIHTTGYKIKSFIFL